MNRHALEVLELPETLALVAGYAASEVGGEAVRALQPSTDPEVVRAEVAAVGEMIAFLGRDGGWAMPAVPDLRTPLSRLPLEGYVWPGSTLHQAGVLVDAGRAVRRALLPLAEELGRLASLAGNVAELPGVAEEIARAIGEDGEVRDKASPELGRLRREINGARGRIVSRLTEFAASLPPNYQVSDASVSIREGRYVVPIRREGRGEVGGIVHGESQTGATLFVEPPLAIELMNRLRELEAAEAREVQRILREQTERLRPYAAELGATLGALVRLDSLYARARYARGVYAHPPDIVAAGGAEVTIVQGRHPLLVATGEPVVPFDLRMEPGERTLIVSGPNTGGKTVLLKAMGLIALMTQCGIVPPVGPGSRVAVFGDVYADIGDEQSIEASLSTFSAHLKNLRETLEGANAASLVLIDEIGSGTDPVEGGALARAILLELTERSAFTLATTHLGQLKLLAADDPRVVNASLQFDAERLEPTYRLQKGVPGRSYGLAIARRLGLSADVLNTAEAALPRGERDVAKLLLDLEAKEQRLSRSTAELEAELARTRELNESLEERERSLARREKDAERRARQQARDMLMEARAEVEAAIQEVRGAADEQALAEAARAARRRVEEAARRQRERSQPGAGRPAGEATAADLAPGLRVRIESLGRTGTVVEVRDSRALVETGGLRMQLSAADLTVLPPGDQETERPRPRVSRGAGYVEADLDARPEVDLRGLRVDDLELRLSRALDSALLAGLPTFRIIHGKGTGALRAQVEELLRADPRIATFRPGDRFEGGTGVTVVEFG